MIPVSQVLVHYFNDSYSSVMNHAVNLTEAARLIEDVARGSFNIMIFPPFAFSTSAPQQNPINVLITLENNNFIKAPAFCLKWVVWRGDIFQVSNLLRQIFENKEGKDSKFYLPADGT